MSYGDSGSTTCPKSARGTSMSYPAVSPYVTAVGGTRLALGAGNARAGESVWNDTPYGQRAVAGSARWSRDRPTRTGCSNDLAGVGCCTAGPGYDAASGLRVPDWAALPATLPPPA